MLPDTMMFFRQIKTGVDIAPLLNEINPNETAWHSYNRRNTAVKGNIQNIFLRVAAKRRDIDVDENQETRSTLMSGRFPLAIAFMTSVARDFDSTLERAAIIRVEPQSIADRLMDTGSYHFLRHRFHLVLSSSQGTLLTSGDEQIRMWPGELWWIDNKQHHSFESQDNEWGIQYVFDLLPNSLAQLAVNPIAPKIFSALEPISVQTKNSYDGSADPWNTLRRSIETKGLLRDETSFLISSSGRRYKWMIDMRRVLTDAISLNALAEIFWQSVGHKYPFQIGGLETAAIPIISAIQMKSVSRGTPVNGFIMRKERKMYGAGQLIEGSLNHEPIIIVDDIMNSGKSMEKVRAVLDAYDQEIAEVFVAIDYKSSRGNDWRTKYNVPVTAPFSLADFDLDIAIEESKSPRAPIFTKAWSFTSPRGNFYHRVPKSFPITDTQRIYFGTDNGTFWALNAQDGSVAWKFLVRTAGNKNIWSAPALHDNCVFFGAYDGNVYCLEAATGLERWRYSEADWIGSSPAIAPDLGLLFIGLEFSTPGKKGSVIALDLSTGEKIWEHETVRYTHASPAYCAQQKLVACGSNDDEIFLFDAATGAVRWRFQTRGEGRKGSIRHAPAFDTKRGNIITGCADGYIYVISIETGREVWSVLTDNEVYTVPLCDGDLAYVGSTDKYLYVLDLEKRLVRKRHAMFSKIYAPPRLLDGAIYVGACNGLIYKLDRESAEITGSFQLPDAITNAMTCSSDKKLFYALTYVNELYALKPIGQA